MRLASGALVYQEWISGAGVQRTHGQLLAQLLTAIQGHETTLDALSANDYFDYWLDYIRPRSLRAGNVVGLTKTVSDLSQRVDIWWQGGKIGLSHPDITRRNIVINDQQSPVVIDNELLSLGRRPEYDLCNTAHSSRRCADEIAFHFRTIRSAGAFSRGDTQTVNIAWALRRAGSSYQAAQMTEARKWIELASSGAWALPFSRKAWDALTE